jgi:hypothetical protein
MKDYFARLARYEGKDPEDLVGRWDPDDRTAITTALRDAFLHCDRKLRVPRHVSLSSLGNRIAAAFATRIRRHLVGFELKDCPGNGYPDKRLVRLEDNFSFVFEIKAKTKFDRRDWNRIVLTSTSSKLRMTFLCRPICHLLVTVFHSRLSPSFIEMRNVRLDFLEPSSFVQQRFEASVSHYLLARSEHESRLLIVETSTPK